MKLEDLWLDVAAGEEKVNGVGVHSRRVEFRSSRRITFTTAFDVEKARAEAHMALDAALDELVAVVALVK